MNSAWELIAENRIDEAMQRGDFDNLPGKGRPIDLTEYFNTPAEERLAFSILKNAGFVPPEVELRREIDALEAQLCNSHQAREHAQLRQLIQAKRAKLAFSSEQRRKSAGRKGQI